MRCLLDVGDAQGEGAPLALPLVAAGFAPVSRRLESAGASFFARFERVEAGAGGSESAESRENASASSDRSGSAGEDARWAERDQQRRRRGVGGGNPESAPSKLKKLLAGPNLYDVLGVSESDGLGVIRRNYHKLCLEYHPDKLAKGVDGGSGGGEAAGAVAAAGDAADSAASFAGSPAAGSGSAAASPASAGTAGADLASRSSAILRSLPVKEAFLLVQSAYEILSKEDLRRQYDGGLPFDDSVPSAKECAAAASAGGGAPFYALLRPVFLRNARWSARKPVPDFGDDGTDARAVRRFYQFWESFESLRDFSVHDEHDLSDAECREERRWMERENAKARRPHEVRERERVLGLVRLARAHDPRLRREKMRADAAREELRAAREREAAERRREAERLAEEAARAERERREREASEKLRAAEEQKRQKARMRGVRVRLRERCKALVAQTLLPNDTMVEDLLANLPIDQLEALVAEVEKEEEGAGTSLAGKNGPAPAPGTGASAGKASAAAAAGAAAAPGCAASGAAASGAAASGAAAVITAAWTAWVKSEQARRDEAERRAKEIIAAKRTSGGGKSGGAPAAAGAAAAEWSAAELKLLAKGLQRYPGGTARRWHLIAQMVGGARSQEEVIAQARKMADSGTLKSMGSELSKRAFQQYIAENEGVLRVLPQGAEQRDIADLKEGPAAAAADDGTWPELQQKALEAALRTFPATMDKKERWTKIAEMVPGKSAKDCVMRFKQLRSALLQQR